MVSYTPEVLPPVLYCLGTVFSELHWVLSALIMYLLCWAEALQCFALGILEEYTDPLQTGRRDVLCSYDSSKSAQKMLIFIQKDANFYAKKPCLRRQSWGKTDIFLANVQKS